MRKKYLLFSAMFIVIIGVTLVGMLTVKSIKEERDLQTQIRLEQTQRAEMIASAKAGYNKYVNTISEKDLYELVDGKYIVCGNIEDNIDLTLEDIDVENISDKYYKLEGKEYYIDYLNLQKIDGITRIDTNYKKYIPFNENIITKWTTSLYKEGKKVFTINKSYDLPIIVKEENSYGVEFGGQLLYINKEDVENIRENQNSSEQIAKDVPVLLYHFFHPAGSHPEYESWTTVITLRADKLENQLKYLKENGYMTLKMNELEMFIDGKINIPEKSVVLTIDDGDPSIYEIAASIIEKYEANFTVFNVCSYYPDAINKQTEFIEIHSHSYELHQGGCDGGQGGLIKCIDKDKGIEDLKKSSEMLNGSKYFAYPFGEYTDHSIEILKEAGYTMAFTTNWGNAKIGDNKFLLPRYYLYNEWTLNTFISRIK